MVNVPYPKNEAERLHALQTLNILDTPSEERFDRVTRLAKRLLGMPIVMVTMVDEDRQWFKSRIGVDLVETPRELSICTYTILEDEVLIIPDMQQDQRFISHPFVVDEPHIRFYAGYPLSTPDGHRVGTLCVLDTQPHSFDDEQIEILQDLANIAQTELNLAEVKQLQADLTTLTHSLEDEIIDHNRTIEKLRQQQVFLRQIIDLNPHLIFARNREGVFTLANKAFAAIYGVSPETLCGKDDIDFQLDPQIIEAYREDDLAIMNTRQESVTPEQSITTTEGEKRWWNITKRPIVNEDGSVDQILGVVTDITERKRAEIELQKSEEQFRLVFELAPIGMAVVGFDGRFRSINQAFCQTLGYTTQEMLQKTIADITHPDDLETALDQGLLQGTIPHFQTERRYIHKSGKQITAILQVTLVRNTDGTPQHFIVQVVDITERTRAEVALKQQEAFLKQVIDTVPHLIYVKDSAGRFTLINQAVADLYGTPIENILGKRDVDFDIIEDAMMRFLDQDKPVLERGEEMLIPEETVVDAKGQTHWLQTTKRPIIEADHSIKQVVSIAIDITEQKWAEETIRDSQQRLALHFQNTPVGVIEWSPDFEVVDWNPAARRIFGYTRDEVLGKRGSFLMSTGTQEFFDTIWHNLLKKNKGTSGIQPNIRKNRKEIICQWFNTPLRDEKGQIIGVTSLIEDITERRAAEQALRENEARLVKMTANAPGLIFQFVLREDQTGYFSYASAWMRDILGLQPEDLSMDAMPGTSAIHPEDRHDFLRTLGESARLLSHWHWVGRMVSKSGKVIHVQGDAKPELMESGETVWNGVIMDISGRIQAEEERDRLFNLSVDMMAIGGVDGYFKRLNPAFETMLGYTHQELIENPIVEFMHPDDVESIVNHVKAFAVAEPSETFHFENRFLCKDGTYKWLDWTAVSAQYLFYAVARDVTERKIAENELIVSRDRAIEISRLKSELLAKVSHELRTPLGAILGFAEMIQVGVYGEISEQQHEATGKIIESTTYLSSMVNELLDQAQLEARQLILVVDEFDPRDVTNTVQSRMQILAKHKGISLITQVTPSLTSCVYGDEKRIQQILINLVSNAIKFTETGTVKVHCYQPDAFHWAFQVSDTGIGIPTEAQRRIFEPFGQVDGSETREQMGTGLGLSIVQQLTSLMGGQITLKSQVDRGSTFTVTLPIQAKQSLRSDVQNDD